MQDCTKLVAGVTATTAGVWLPQLAVAAAATTDTTTSKLAASAALRSVKIAKKRLQSETVFDYIVQSDYPALQAVLRVAPISEIRKACFVLVRAADDGEDNSTLLSVQYKAFIAALEKLDTTAMVAIRGRALGASEFRDSYDATVSALSDFVETAEKSVVTISPVTAVAVAAESNAD